ncbi:hypothetical protein AgCh_028423 [Apium graveolens]
MSGYHQQQQLKHGGRRSFRGRIIMKDSTSLPSQNDPDMSEEMEKTIINQLSDELKLIETEATETQHIADKTLLDTKKLVSQYQKEADKCTSGMGTCEEAREKAEITLRSQQEHTAMWELRALQNGWKHNNDL